jgi:hypothetical protein
MPNRDRQDRARQFFLPRTLRNWRAHDARVLALLFWNQAGILSYSLLYGLLTSGVSHFIKRLL